MTDKYDTNKKKKQVSWGQKSYHTPSITSKKLKEQFRKNFQCYELLNKKSVKNRIKA